MSMTPTTRLEKWLAKIAGESVDITPKDRLETLLAKIAGESVSITPDDSLEYWLNQIAENGGGGSSDFSTVTVTFVNASESNVRLDINMGNTEGYMYGFYIGEYGITSDAIELLAESESSVSANFFLMNNGIADAYISYSNGATVSVSGDIVLAPDLVEESFHLQISGSGTITYSI